MAQPTTSPFAEFVILVGDGASPTEVFAPICGLTSKGVEFSTSTQTSMVPDCADENLPSYEEEDVTAVAVRVTGKGVFPRENSKVMQLWVLDGLVKNIRLKTGRSIATDIDYYAGPAILKKLSLSVEKGGRVEADVELAFTRKPTIVLKA